MPAILPGTRSAARPCPPGADVDPGRVAAAFDHLAAGWDEGHGPRSGRRIGFALRAALLRDLLLGCPQHRVLDVGCGTGQYLLALGPLLVESVGIDISPAMIERARGNARMAAAGWLSFGLASAESFRAPEGEPFDLVFFLGSLEHVAAPARAVANAAHLLRPGGLLAVVVLHPLHPRGLLAQRGVRRGTMPPLRLIPPKLVRDWAEAAGLSRLTLFKAMSSGGSGAWLRWAVHALLIPFLTGNRVLVFRSVWPGSPVARPGAAHRGGSRPPPPA